MIEAFFKDKEALKNAGMDQNIYSKLIEKSPKLFDVSEYTTKTTSAIEDMYLNKSIHPSEQAIKYIEIV